MTPQKGQYWDVGELYYQPDGGKLHRVGCRYFVTPGENAIFTMPEITPAFWSQACCLCSRECSVPPEPV